MVAVGFSSISVATGCVASAEASTLGGTGAATGDWIGVSVDWMVAGSGS